MRLIYLILNLLISYFLCSTHEIEIKSKRKEFNCTINHQGHQLIDGQSIELNGKIYKMEDCSLQRAYHACGTHLLFIINIVCRAVEHKKSTKDLNQSKYNRRFSRKKLLTEACCQTLCTVNEMTRYCSI